MERREWTATKNLIRLKGRIIASTDSPERALAIVTEHNQHTTLVEQRDRLAAALRNLIRQLPSDERLADYNLDEAETVLATVEQGEGA